MRLELEISHTSHQTQILGVALVAKLVSFLLNSILRARQQPENAGVAAVDCYFVVTADDCHSDVSAKVFHSESCFGVAADVPTR